MRRVSSISLALVLLVTNLSFTKGTHYCGGQPVMSRLMIGDVRLHCGMPNMDSVCEHKAEKGRHFKAKPCCENHFQTYRLVAVYKSGLTQLALDFDFVVVAVRPFLIPSFAYISTYSQYADYSPPFLEKDIQELFQTFLI